MIRPFLREWQARPTSLITGSIVTLERPRSGIILSQSIMQDVIHTGAMLEASQEVSIGFVDLGAINCDYLKIAAPHFQSIVLNAIQACVIGDPISDSIVGHSRLQFTTRMGAV